MTVYFVGGYVKEFLNWMCTNIIQERKNETDVVLDEISGVFYGAVHVRLRRHTDEVVHLADLVCDLIGEGCSQIVLDYGDTVAVKITVSREYLANPICFSFVAKRVRQYDLPIRVRQKVLKRVMSYKPTRTGKKESFHGKNPNRTI